MPLTCSSFFILLVPVQLQPSRKAHFDSQHGEIFMKWHLCQLCLCQEKSPISAEVAAVVGTAAQNKYLSIGLSNC